MKSFKTLMAGLLVVAFAAAAHATTTEKIYLVGSTAYRSSVHTAIINQLNAGGAYTYAYSSSSGASAIGAAPGNAAAGSGASQQIYSGTIAGHTVVIKTNWTGSAGGVQAVTQGITTNFMTDASLSGATSAGLLVAGTVTDPETPTVTMSDVFQSSTPFASPALTVGGTNTAVGVVPFVFVINADWTGADGSFNVTPQLARSLWGGTGAVDLSVFTGNPASSGTSVFATGRDNDSGTRLTAFAETGVGAAATVVQVQPFFGGSVTSITSGTGTAAGTGYSSPPTVQIVGSGGLGYSSAPSVATNGGGGTASLTAVLTNGSVTSITVNSSSGFTSNPTLTFTGGGATIAAAASNFTPFVDTGAGSLTQGQITQVFISNPGSGATATATINSGTLASVTVNTPGSGYESAPTVNLVGGGFTTAASATAKEGNNVCTGINFWPPETVNGIALIQGNGGFSSGGSLAVALGSTGVIASDNGYLLSYLGTSDAATATGLQVAGTFSGTGLGAKTCTYNGVTYSQTAVQQGQYTFWGYEHMYYGSGIVTPAPDGAAIVNAIANQISSTDAVITLPSMFVSRPTDGGVVTHN